jgi:hypothetical protein
MDTLKLPKEMTLVDTVLYVVNNVITSASLIQLDYTLTARDEIEFEYIQYKQVAKDGKLEILINVVVDGIITEYLLPGSYETDNKKAIEIFMAFYNSLDHAPSNHAYYVPFSEN